MERPGQKYWSISYALPCGAPALFTCNFQGIVAVFINKGKPLRPVGHVAEEEMCERSSLICQAKEDTIVGIQDSGCF